jgi:uncharacterized membrane protein
MLGRILRHILATRRGVRRAFPDRTLDAVERAVREGEARHAGEVRFAIETELAWPALLAGVSARARALEVFSQLRVWDTEHNNGVLVYVLFADRQVEIVADRGFNDRVTAAEWQAICETMREHFSHGRFEEGAVQGVAAVSRVMEAVYPAGAAGSPDEMPDRPVIL